MGLIALLFVVVIIGAVTSQSRQETASSRSFGFSGPIHTKKHGWITLSRSSKLDLWDSPNAFCDGLNAIADELVQARREGREPDFDYANRLPGHNIVESGMRVTVLGHAERTCDGLNSVSRFTRIEVTDRDSSSHGHRGYITEGLLSKQ
jgi:hypothetical protein